MYKKVLVSLSLLIGMQSNSVFATGFYDSILLLIVYGAAIGYAGYQKGYTDGYKEGSEKLYTNNGNSIEQNTDLDCDKQCKSLNV